MFGNKTVTDSKLDPESLANVLNDAIKSGQHKIVNRLLIAGAPLLPDKDGNTPLHHAAKSNDVTMLRTILANKTVNCTQKNNAGQTPIEYAVYNESYAAVAEFAKHRTDKDDKSGYGRVLLTLLSNSSHDDLAKKLIAQGANLNEIDQEGNTCLHKAAYAGNVKMVKLLLSYRVDTTIKNKNNKTAMEIASSTAAGHSHFGHCYYWEIVDLISQHQINIKHNLDEKATYEQVKRAFKQSLHDYFGKNTSHSIRVRDFLHELDRTRSTDAILTLVQFEINVFADPDSWAIKTSNRKYEQAPKNGHDAFNEILADFLVITQQLKQRETAQEEQRHAVAVSASLDVSKTVPSQMISSSSLHTAQLSSISIPSTPLPQLLSIPIPSAPPPPQLMSSASSLSVPQIMPLAPLPFAPIEKTLTHEIKQAAADIARTDFVPFSSVEALPTRVLVLESSPNYPSIFKHVGGTDSAYLASLPAQIQQAVSVNSVARAEELVRIEKEKEEKTRIEQQKMEHEKAEKIKQEAERLEKERIQKETLAKEQQEKERIERERIAQEAARERTEQERIAREQAEKERAEQERQAQENAAREKVEKERAEQEKAAKQQIENKDHKETERSRSPLQTFSIMSSASHGNKTKSKKKKHTKKTDERAVVMSMS